MNINQKINFRMANLIASYVLTKDPELRNILPANCKSKARYNSCYDFVSPAIPTSEVNRLLNEGSEKSKTYIKNNLSRNNYLKMTLVGNQYGISTVHSLIKELPMDYLDLERTGAVRFIDCKDVKVK